VGMRVKRPTSNDSTSVATCCSATSLSTMSGRFPLHGGGPGRSIQDARALVFGDRRRPNLQFDGLSRCARPWAGRSDGMMRPQPVERIVRRVALPKPIARSLGSLRGLARAGFGCSTSWVRKPSSSFAMRPVHAFVALALDAKSEGYTLTSHLT